jgi:hypothetical protein
MQLYYQVKSIFFNKSCYAGQNVLLYTNRDVSRQDSFRRVYYFHPRKSPFSDYMTEDEGITVLPNAWN